MANETRPRRESSSTSRLRAKAAQPASASTPGDDDSPLAPFDPIADPSNPDPTSAGPVAPSPIPSTAPASPPFRDREPARFRDRPAAEREGGLSIRERIAARERGDRESTRVDSREAAPTPRPREVESARDRAPDQEPAPLPVPSVSTSTTAEASAPPPGPAPLEGLPQDDDDAFGDNAIHDRYEDIKRGEIHLTELQKMTMPQLIRAAKSEGVIEFTGLKKQDLIFKILKERVKQNGLMFGEGTLGNPARRLRLPAQPRLSTTSPGRTTSTSPRARSAASA